MKGKKREKKRKEGSKRKVTETTEWINSSAA